MRRTRAAAGRPAAWVLGIVLAAVTPPAAAVGHDVPPAEVEASAAPASPVTDSWASNICSFALLLAKLDPGFGPSAILICARAYSHEDG